MGDVSMSANVSNIDFSGPIEFPGLNITVDPSITFFGTSVHWYGVLIALGLTLAVIVCLQLGKKHGVSADVIFDAVIFGAPAGIIGARLYYVIFSWDYYKDHLSEIFMIWNGGLAIYGGVILAVVVGLIYCRVRKINPLKLMDLGGIGFPIGQAVGRWGNFVNREAFGGPAGDNVLFRMKLYTEDMLTWAQVHPTFLYESLWNICTVVFLIWLIKRKKFDGQVFWTYILTYGIGRFWIEGLRTDSLYIGNFRVSQLLALITAVAATVIIVYNLIKVKKQQTAE